MAWNPTPEVAALRDYAKRFGGEYIVLIHINEREEKMGVVTYGETREKCGRAKKLGDVAYNAVYKDIEESGL